MKTKRIFLLFSIVVFVFLLLISAKFIIAQTWVPPLAPFPGGDTNPPIDTGSSYQEKAAGLGFSFTNAGTAIKLKVNQYINFLPNTTLMITPDGNLVVSNPSGTFYINTQGLVLPRFNKESNPGVFPANPVAGMVVYDEGVGKIKFHDGTGWKDVGTGTVVSGGTAVGWLRNNAGGFIYLTTSTDKVGIGTGSEGV